jgi:hypothetical protein
MIKINCFGHCELIKEIVLPAATEANAVNFKNRNMISDALGRE